MTQHRVFLQINILSGGLAGGENWQVVLLYRTIPLSCVAVYIHGRFTWLVCPTVAWMTTIKVSWFEKDYIV